LARCAGASNADEPEFREARFWPIALLAEFALRQSVRARQVVTRKGPQRATRSPIPAIVGDWLA